MARSPASLVAGTIVLTGLIVVGTRMTSRATTVNRIDPDDPCIEMGTCDFQDGEGGDFVDAFAAESQGPLLPPETCRNAGYLCAGMASRNEDRVMRWPDGVREIRVRVPVPEFEDRGRQRAYQTAAINGIRAWSGNPFEIRILRDDRGEADFEVRWHMSLGGDQLGRASTQWSNGPNGPAMRVLALDLVTRRPRRQDSRIEAAQVGLTAAHEMGHALGLPHSDNRRDVMYPTNSASRLTAADYETMRALYSIENGARIDLSEVRGNDR